MFICNDCLRDKFQNGQSLFKSSGSCEICNEQATCNEIQSSQLVRKPSIDPMTGLPVSKGMKNS